MVSNLIFKPAYIFLSHLLGKLPSSSYSVKSFLSASVNQIPSETTKLIAKKGIGIRQAYAEDTELQENPKLTIITEEIVSGDVINEFLKIKGVTRVSIY